MMFKLFKCWYSLSISYGLADVVSQIDELETEQKHLQLPRLAQLYLEVMHWAIDSRMAYQQDHLLMPDDNLDLQKQDFKP